ncbi:hypothetical protein FVE85_6830 [Porphyridium purpureum]|uniref:Uncharacterized protein n=1 Tax=Porphyridium purpureum TaxID=35688 RepID=A0A5J4Z7C8_PORPP|nr:hypothetical protein FVE85_6830 [Porphyridium purpureum]|eukprot:POR8258..scf295_1
MSEVVVGLGKRLLHKNEHVSTLAALQGLAAQGYDVSDCVGYVLRYILMSQSRDTLPMSVVSLALELVTCTAAHRTDQWEQVVQMLCEMLQHEQLELVRMALTRVGTLPFAAIQAVVIRATGHIVALGSHPNAYIRRAAVRAALAAVMRERALTFVPSADDAARSLLKTAPSGSQQKSTQNSTISVSLDASQHPPLSQHELPAADRKVLMASLEKLTLMICESTLDDDDGVAVNALWNAVNFASAARKRDPLLSTRNALASAMWDLLLANISSIATRMDDVSDSASADIRWRREARAALATLAAVALSGVDVQISIENDADTDTGAVRNVMVDGGAEEDMHKLRKWALSWTDAKLSKLMELDLGHRERADAAKVGSLLLASFNLLHICHSVQPHNKSDVDYQAHVIRWATRALSCITRLLTHYSRDSDRYGGGVQAGSREAEEGAHVSTSTGSSGVNANGRSDGVGSGPHAQDLSRTILSYEEIGKAISLFTRSLRSAAGWGVSISNVLANCAFILRFIAARKSEHERACNFRVVCELVVSAEIGVAQFSADRTGGSVQGHAGATVKLVSSREFSGIMSQGLAKRDMSVACELLASLYQACLHAARWVEVFELPPNAKQAPVVSGPDGSSIDVRSRQHMIAEAWALLTGKVLIKTSRVLVFPHCSTLSYAREYYLKLFEALGQFSAYLQRPQQSGGASGAGGLQEYETVQELLIQCALKQDDPNVRSALITSSTKYWLESGLKSEASVGQMQKAMWRHLLREYRDRKRAIEYFQDGRYWVPALSQGDAARSTFQSDHALTVCSAAVELIKRVPRHADALIGMLRKYYQAFRAARCHDDMASAYIVATLNSLAIFNDKYHPKPVEARLLARFQSKFGYAPLGWLASVSESCIRASSRHGLTTPDLRALIGTEHAQIRAATAIHSLAGAGVDKYRVTNEFWKQYGQDHLRPEHDMVADPPLLAGFRQQWDWTSSRESSASLMISGSADPFGIVASHALLVEAGILRVRLAVTNRTRMDARNVSVRFASSGGLQVFSDQLSERWMGAFTAGESKVVVLPFRCDPRSLQNTDDEKEQDSSRNTAQWKLDRRSVGEAFVFCTLVIHKDEREAGSASGAADVVAMQPALPYSVPISEILLLLAPGQSCGLDVFRRRWDVLSRPAQFYVFIDATQDLNILVDVLQRRAPLREVGRMRNFTHFSALASDSVSGHYVTVAVYAAEAETRRGRGPCMATVQVRSAQYVFSESFALECRQWLAEYDFRIVDLENAKRTPQELKVFPRDQYYLKSGQELNVHARWRNAQYARMHF